MIELRGVSKLLGRRSVLKGLGLTVQSGECVVITGASGAGKTTLLRLAAGLETPDEGSVLLRGVEVSKPGWARAPHERKLSFQFQDPALWPHMSLLENVAYGLNGERDRAFACLSRAELGGLAARKPAEISGGEARRAALARTLAPRRDVVLLDEPLANLQPALRAAMARWIGEELAAAGASCLWVAHDPEEALGIASRVLVLADGNLGGPS